MNHQRINNLLSGRSKGMGPRLARTGLRSLEPVYRTVINYRNRRFDRRSGVIDEVPVPVLSIGNLTTGGTGKTPMVRWMCQLLLSLGQEPAIVSRGYGSKGNLPNDEYMELNLYLPQVTHIQNPDRIIAANQAFTEHHATSIVLDDGFQHRRIARQLDLVLVDATCPFGHDHLLPRGLLREPVESLKRADAVVITRCDQVTTQQIEEIQTRISKYVDPERIARSRFQPGPWFNLNGQVVPDSEDDGHSRVFGFCGIGNPLGFLISMEQRFPDFEACTFTDHHSFDSRDLDRINELARQHQAEALVCTVKDLVKVRKIKRGLLPIYALSIDVQFESGQSMLENLVRQSVSPVKTRCSPVAEDPP